MQFLGRRTVLTVTWLVVAGAVLAACGDNAAAACEDELSISPDAHDSTIDGLSSGWGQAASLSRFMTPDRSKVLPPPSITVSSIALSPDGRRLAAGCKMSSRLCVWDTSDGSISNKFDANSPVAWSMDGSLIAASSKANVLLLDSESGEEIRALKGHTKPDIEDGPTGISGLEFSPDNSKIASAAHDGTVRLWSVSDGETLAELDVLDSDTKAPRDLAFSPDGKCIAVSSRDSPVQLWDVDSGELVTTLNDTKPRPEQVTFSPDGRWLATSPLWGEGAKEPVSLWDTSTLEQKKKLDHDADIGDIAFGPKGKRLAISDTSDDKVVVWSHESDETQTIKIDQGRPAGVLFSPHGRYLYAGSRDDRGYDFNEDPPKPVDSSLIKWDLKTGDPVTHFEEP